MTAAALTDDSDLQGMQVRYTDEPSEERTADAEENAEPSAS
jgi:hypothetical protein